MRDRTWQVNVDHTEQGERARAGAIPERASERLHGHGRAKRAPDDRSVQVPRRDLATARAPADLMHQPLHAAAARIEAFEGRPEKGHG